MLDSSPPPQKTDLKEITKMDKWECLVCGYIYDPAENDDVAFEDLPDDWVCPDCGAGKDMFEKLS
jgi:rubredoxin